MINCSDCSCLSTANCCGERIGAALVMVTSEIGAFQSLLSCCRFEASRKERTTRVQATSRANTWLRGKTDADWVYGYDAWTVPLAA